MGMFRNIRDMKEAVAAAPDMIQQAQQLQQAAAQQQIAAQQAAQAHGAAVGGTPAPVLGELGEADLEPIAGVSLELYAEISKGLAAVGYDLTQAPHLAAVRGVAAPDWQAAVDGWNQRMLSNPALAQRFNQHYTGR